MRGTAAALCIAVVSLLGATLPAVAEATPCADNMFTALQKSRAPNSIPKTKTVRRAKKTRATVAHRARPSVEPKRVSLTPAKLLPPTPLLRVVERSDEPTAVDDLELAWFTFDFVLDDPSRTAVPRLRPCLAAFTELELPPTPAPMPREGVRSRVVMLRTKLLPKIPQSSDSVALLG